MTRQTKAPEGQASIAAEFGDALINFPLFLVEYIASLIAVTISQTHITTLAFAGLTVGYATSSWEVGLATYFVLFSVSRIAGLIADSIGHTGRYIASAIGQGLVQHGFAVREALDPTPQPDEPTAPLA